MCTLPLTVLFRTKPVPVNVFAGNCIFGGGLWHLMAGSHHYWNAMISTCHRCFNIQLCENNVKTINQCADMSVLHFLALDSPIKPSAKSSSKHIMFP